MLESKKPVAVRDPEPSSERGVPVDFTEYCRLLTSRARLERYTRDRMRQSVVDVRSGVRYELRSPGSGLATEASASAAAGASAD